MAGDEHQFSSPRNFHFQQKEVSTNMKIWPFSSLIHKTSFPTAIVAWFTVRYTFRSLATDNTDNWTFVQFSVFPVKYLCRYTYKWIQYITWVNTYSHIPIRYRDLGMERGIIAERKVRNLVTKTRNRGLPKVPEELTDVPQILSERPEWVNFLLISVKFTNSRELKKIIILLRVI